MLLREGTKTNWLHLYVPATLLPDAKKAAGTIQAFNKTGKDIEIHTTLDSFLSLSVMRQAIQDWIKLAWKGKKLQGSIAITTQMAPDLWPLFAEDWRESTRGVTAMSNTLYRGLFNAALKALPKQQIGCYLQENQGWEFALIQNWRMSNHCQLIGVPHSSVRFWDLSYFFDYRCYTQNRVKAMPMPDKVAVNGPAAADAYIKGGYPSEHLVQVEALRYLHLVTPDTRSKSVSAVRRKGLRLLVLGDYLASNTRRQMCLLAQSAVSLPAGTEINVKPHPACPIHAEDYPELRVTITIDPLMNLLAECDVVYASATTSASVDAYCAGVPVVSVSDPTMLNMSPLRGHSGVSYVSSSRELTKALQAAYLGKIPLPPKICIFNLNTALPLWRHLLTRSV
jgi:surface carbohydrate biosynthesis protein (TIGR04326 family)